MDGGKSDEGGDLAIPSLGVSADVPVGFKEIRLRFDIDTDASAEMREQLLQLVERYCVIFQTIQNSPSTTVKLHRVIQ